MTGPGREPTTRSAIRVPSDRIEEIHIRRVLASVKSLRRPPRSGHHQAHFSGAGASNYGPPPLTAIRLKCGGARTRPARPIKRRLPFPLPMEEQKDRTIGRDRRVPDGRSQEGRGTAPAAGPGDGFPHAPTMAGRSSVMMLPERYGEERRRE